MSEVKPLLTGIKEEISLSWHGPNYLKANNCSNVKPATNYSLKSPNEEYSPTTDWKSCNLSNHESERERLNLHHNRLQHWENYAVSTLNVLSI